MGPLVGYYYGELFHLSPTLLLYGSTYFASVTRGMDMYTSDSKETLILSSGPICHAMPCMYILDCLHHFNTYNNTSPIGQLVNTCTSLQTTYTC